jgi:hypothetical protein
MNKFSINLLFHPVIGKEYFCLSYCFFSIQYENCNPLAKLPVDIQLRGRQVFSSVLKYAYDLLTLDTMMKVVISITVTISMSLRALKERILNSVSLLLFQELNFWSEACITPPPAMSPINSRASFIAQFSSLLPFNFYFTFTLLLTFHCSFVYPLSFFFFHIFSFFSALFISLSLPPNPPGDIGW